MRIRHILPLYFLVAALLLLPIGAAASGFLPVRNFGRENYQGGPQNWCVAQDSIGRIYVGNRDGMLRFDGQRWHKFLLPNFTTVRSVMFDAPSSRIYASGSEEFGYFSEDSVKAGLTYTSLIDRFRGARPAFSEVWNIFRSGEKIYFQSDNHLFAYNGSDVVSYQAPGRISRSALIRGIVMLALEDGRLVRFNGTAFENLPGTESLRGNKIAALLPMANSGKVIVATSVNGLYLYDGERLAPLETDITDFLKENQVFCAAGDGVHYIFGTVNRGAVVKDLATGTVRFINRETGLQNNTVLGAMFDRSGNIWLSLDNGLDYILYNSPVSILIGAYNTVGAGYASLLKGNKVYFGTNQGLYSAPYPFQSSPSPLSLHRELHGQIWSITDIGGKLFVGGDAGLFVSQGGGFIPLSGLPGTYKVVPLNNNPNQAIASTYDGFHLLENKNGLWEHAGRIEGYDDIGGDFLQDNDGFLWLPHWRKGVYRLRFDTATRTFSERLMIDTVYGLPNAHNNNVALFNDRPVIVSDEGYFDFDNSTRILSPDTELQSLLPENVHGRLTALPDGSLVVADGGSINIARRQYNGQLVMEENVFRSLADKLMPGFVNINAIAPDELIISNQDGFWSMSLTSPSHTGWNPKPFVNAVYANLDSLVYQAPAIGREEARLTLPHALNAVRLEFACPDYTSPNSVEFSSFLEGYDDNWTPFSTESTREYARLPEGTYTFRLQSRHTQTGEISESEFTLTIRPPWYRSTPAKIAYILLGIILILGIWFLTARWMRKIRHRMDQKRVRELNDLRLKSEQDALVKDYEIATLKSAQLEHDIRHKSQELSSTTMNLVRKNEMLRDIASKISRIQEMPGLDGLTQRHLAKIQTSIEENISHDNDWKTINQNFDIVYENYTKRLMELHPNLSVADKRMCCYIKMGLSSKEIAPLLNISYKSVEMARYRLRKKMEIPTDHSLSDYLANL